MDESKAVRERLEAARLAPDAAKRVEERAARWVNRIRETRAKLSPIDAFLHEYQLSSREGVVLMCLAEAFLRIPDDDTADALIRETVGGGRWEDHAGRSGSTFVNAATWALMLTGRVIEPVEEPQAWNGVLRGLVQRTGEPVVRTAVRQAMRIMGGQFVMGRTIKEALDKGDDAPKNVRHSFDMLGEAAMTAADAARYFDAYAKAIAAIGKANAGKGHIDADGISVKLSALHPRYEFAQADRAIKELAPRLIELCQLAKEQDIGLTVDAEEADRLDLSLDVIGAAVRETSLKGWNGLGLAMQAYQKRALPLCDVLQDMALSAQRRLMVRLVKGAYWDTEIKRAQEAGLEGYPVFTRKAATDVSFLACMKKLMADPSAFYPCIATHNAHSASAALETAGLMDFEFQRLHGMGEPLYEAIAVDAPERPVRVYAPVGSHEDLLAYLVRRLLENGANTSFVNRIVDESLPVREIVADPVARLAKITPVPHPRIPLPKNIFGAERENSAGADLTHVPLLRELQSAMSEAAKRPLDAQPIISGIAQNGTAHSVLNPANHSDVVGYVTAAKAEDARAALKAAHQAQEEWNATPAATRAAILTRAADLMEERHARLMMLAIREAGKTLGDAVAEIREAVDFMRYYAARAKADFSAPLRLPGPTGEDNSIALHGRGVFLCIAPWNFPLAIFTGQVAAALAAGNAVLAKPAEQTPLIAAEAVRILHEAGVPGDVLHLLPGDGATIGNAVLSDARLSGVAFTGSTETAQIINRTLAGRDGPLAALIAETGGQNAMIVDSSALPEQVTRDAVMSAFRSAGQRCSALRVLFLQEDVADKITAMIQGAMAELRVGDPALLSTDVGPVIDQDALDKLNAHMKFLSGKGKILAEAPAPAGPQSGTFFTPKLAEISGIDVLPGEVFGPVLHVVRWKLADLDQVIGSINATGFGLTAAVHSRLKSRVDYITARLKAGNIYVNRNQIGAVVGVQPFGGEGLSGTGPKAGGPRYLHRFAVERVTAVDTTAGGGNAALLAGGD